MPHLKMVWTPAMFQILGIWFTQDLKEHVAINYNKSYSLPETSRSLITGVTRGKAHPLREKLQITAFI